MLGPLEEVLQGAHERLGPDGHEQLITVRRNALRLLKLVNTLLDFSRIEVRRKWRSTRNLAVSSADLGSQSIADTAAARSNLPKVSIAAYRPRVV
jgi:signal transduction histidine kinase